VEERHVQNDRILAQEHNALHPQDRAIFLRRQAAPNISQLQIPCPQNPIQ
jgi:hypothetical protein